MEKRLKKSDIVKKSKVSPPTSLIGDLFDTGLFKSPVSEELSPEVRELLENF